MADISLDQLAGRITALEFILSQQLALTGSNAANIDAFFGALDESLSARIDRLPTECRQYAHKTRESVFSVALQTAKEISSHKGSST